MYTFLSARALVRVFSWNGFRFVRSRVPTRCLTFELVNIDLMACEIRERNTIRIAVHNADGRFIHNRVQKITTCYSMSSVRDKTQASLCLLRLYVSQTYVRCTFKTNKTNSVLYHYCWDATRKTRVDFVVPSRFVYVLRIQSFKKKKKRFKLCFFLF